MDELCEGAVWATFLDLAHATKYGQFIVSHTHISLKKKKIIHKGRRERGPIYLIRLNIIFCNRFELGSRYSIQEAMND